MGEQPPFSSRAYRRSLLEFSKFRTREIQTQERSRSAREFPWSSFDAGITGTYSFESWFKIVLPEGETSMQAYIEETLGSKSVRRGLELGGMGSRFFGEFSPGFFHATAAITLTNFYINSPYQYPYAVERDNARNHTVIEGNIFDDDDPDTVKTTKQKTIEWAQGEKIDLIVERMYAGRDLLPDDPFYLSKEASFWYRQLAEGGLLFAELPRAFNYHIKQWEAYIKEKYAGKLDVTIEKFTPQGEESRYLMRLHKLAGAPEELPLLDVQSVMKRAREFYPHIFSRDPRVYH